MWSFILTLVPPCVSLCWLSASKPLSAVSVFSCFTLIVWFLHGFSVFYFLLLFSCLFFLPLFFTTCVSLSVLPLIVLTCVLLPSCINSPCLGLALFGRCFCSVVASVPSWLFPSGCLIGFVSVVCIFVQVCKSVSVFFLSFFQYKPPILVFDYCLSLWGKLWRRCWLKKFMWSSGSSLPFKCLLLLTIQTSPQPK